MHDAANDKQRLAMFEKVNNAEIKIIIGSTGKLGTGVNIQRKLSALHHLDAPYRPSDIEQRNGRGIRQGNKLTEEEQWAKIKLINDISEEVWGK